ncbi:ATP-binding protein [Draconibacterium halophilum]|uniref:ATP-binding protein n=1 Tax=Draconibacterium halophilum TaxID=2706887 RepID=A0A6C0RAQ5_9BACT|nr:ATP-binding protein [Draconibacterium halophilum]QIA06533.1 ATP-binding protein [Draconibacterium halophilum]
MKNKPTNILVIKSISTEINNVEKFVKAIFNYHNIPKSCFNPVFLCISEAMTNSIVHGNKEDHQKTVELNIDCKSHLIQVRVTDEGEGFDIEKVPDPTHTDNLLKETGRGLHIIKSIAQNVKFNSKGNSLSFEISCD